MGRTIKEIKTELATNFVANAELAALYGLDQTLTFEEQFSKVSLENIWLDNMAIAIWNHEQIVTANAENSRPHTIKWYHEKALSYLDGIQLQWINGQFAYDTTGIDTQDLKIIDRCAVLESSEGYLVMKLATDNGTELTQLTADQFLRFKYYMNLIKDAGNVIVYVNDPADQLKIDISVQVDPSVISPAGILLNVDGNIKPVEDAIDLYLANLEFNGAFLATKFVDQIQQAKGVKDVKVNELASKFANLTFQPFQHRKVPNAGYFKVQPANLTITYTENDLV